MSLLKHLNVFSFDKKDIEIKQKSTRFHGFFKIDEIKFKHKLFKGGWSNIVTREVFERGDAVAVLPYDMERDEIVLLEQIRVGCILNSDNPWMIELVGGMVEQGETPDDVARRETLEEADLHVDALLPMLNYLSSAGGTTERIYIYLAKVDSSTAGDICGLDHEDEDIKVHKVSREQALAWTENGVVENAATLIALQWLELNMAKVKQAWS